MELINHKLPPVGIILQEGFIIMFKDSPGSGRRWMCGCLLSFNYSVVLKLVGWWSVAVSSGLMSCRPLLFTRWYREIAAAKRAQTLCTRSPSTSGKCPSPSHGVQTNPEPAVHFCKRHIFFTSYSGPHVGLNSLWFYFSSFLQQSTT